MWFMRSVSLFFLICSAIGFLQSLAYRPHGWGELVAAGSWYLLIGWALARLSGTMQDNDRIAITNTGIQFDPRWKHSLLGRASRDWTDVHSLDFSGRWKPSDIAHWRLLSGCMFTIDFKSGGAAVIDLGAMTRSDIEQFLIALEQQVGQSVFSKSALLFQRSLMAVDTELPISYETIWTDALESQFGATNFAPLRTGTQLQSAMYEVRMQLASSGLSAVYLAIQKGGRKIVLKESVLPLDTSESARAKARDLFDREAKLLARVDHPQITKVLDNFFEDGREYIVLEFIPGMSLRQLIQTKGAQNETHVMNWAVQTARILDYLHGLDPAIVHRDLTPDNLILRGDNTIVLIDFGVSNEFVSRATGTLVGKQAYIPPEQIRGKAEPKSDIYAFGATMFFLLTGNDPEPLTCLHPAATVSVTKPFDDLIAACTQLDGESRPDASELIVMCEKILSAHGNER
jgi:predicted Ser/Thr protein kinase